MLNKYIGAYQSLLFVAIAFGGCSESGAGEVSGRVLHSETGSVMPRAYVLAAYTITAGGIFGHSSTSCTTTRGMYSRVDGSFSFPALKGHEVELRVIKPGFKEDLSRRVVRERRWFGNKDITLPDVFLMPSPGGEYPVNYAYICASVRSPADSKANIEYLELVYAEAKKYGSAELQNTVKRKFSRMEEEFNDVTDNK